ncbi:MAG: AAA family ATPase [Eubacterium sp.]|nr:AAA family ATPase [Eubacterium sp.]MBQ9022748.1 AAA family ATPase [Eubacterium sp.]
MNIKEARQEIINTVKAYLQKDETGAYVIPTEKQRPILLMGPPGIGKTAILEQAANICGINLIAYTITHHTRQSAIGLPFIATRTYGEKEVSVTEYTMSEIIASIYDRIEQTGIKEGILFLDEINCVSETLAPTMLQFLQYKTFGAHHLPEGFLIVTAGNPPEYNKSVRDFDIVTLDRVKRIDIKEDYPAWKEYAYRAGVHGAIMAYLEIRKEHFYSIRVDLSGKHFVTARGWEDLSRILTVYEELALPVTQGLIVQYLQDEEIAASFCVYYDLYQKYHEIYHVEEIMEGTASVDADVMRQAPFDEKLSLIGLLTDRLNQEFRLYDRERNVQEEIFGALRQIKATVSESDEAGTKGETLLIRKLLSSEISKRRAMYERQKEAHLLDRNEEDVQRRVLAALEELAHAVAMREADGESADMRFVGEWFGEREDHREQNIQKSGAHLTNAFAFLATVYGESQEMALFLSELAAGYYSLKFVSECGNDAYDKYQKLLLTKDRRKEITRELQSFLQI